MAAIFAKYTAMAHAPQATPASQPPRPTTWIERAVASPTCRSGYASLLVHLLLGISLTLAALKPPAPDRRQPLVIALGAATDPASADQPPGDVDEVTLAAPADPAAAGTDASLEEAASAALVTADNPTPFPDAAPPALVPLLAAEVVAEVPPETVLPPHEQAETTLAVRPTSATALSKRISGGPAATRGPRPAAGGVTGPPYASRRGPARGEAALSRGGSAGSEAAVERGLAWLALHQATDGSWRFDLAGCRCDGACRDAGTLDSTTASTAMGLLPFLGAGNTHLEGPYRETVSRAIYYLLSRMKATPRGGDFCEGTLYGHGTTTLSLAEAFGMSGDEMFVPPLREAVRFIETSQDLHGGGWRYLPGQAGDITVTAWQLAALKSAAMSGLETSSPTLDGVRRFLDSVQTQKGAAYGYRTPASKPCTSAIGLLCRMYTGWDDREEALRRGITTLAKAGPQPTAIYQNFYLAQALVQSNHPVWPRWNAKNRDQLIAQQTRIGHEAGSWFLADPNTAPGGRLAHTSLALLTLEVYYRLLPIYQQQAVADPF